MAEIYGISLKKIKTRKDKSGDYVTSGDIYLNKKMCGQYTSTYDLEGACIKADEETVETLEGIIKQYYKDHPMLDSNQISDFASAEEYITAKENGTLPYVTDETMSDITRALLPEHFFEELTSLTYYEREWKKAVKQEYPVIIVVEWFDVAGGPMPAENDHLWLCKKADKATVEYVESAANKTHPGYKLHIFTKAEDFTIRPVAV